MKWYLIAWRRLAEFKGRSRRMEYWMFMLIHGIVFVTLEGASLKLFSAHLTVIGNFLFALSFSYALLAALPGAAVSIRRLHDTGRSGWWMLLAFVPVADLVLMAFFAFDSAPGDNQYGRNPKSPAPAI
ncbi:MAG: DUF805 domain-containing protein [Terracidiphilus sp.]